MAAAAASGGTHRALPLNRASSRPHFVPGLTLTTEAFVLHRRPPADSFQTYSVFSPEHGALLVLQRIPKKPSPNHLALDLFDETALLLESSTQGQTWFVKELRLLVRHGEIGRNYEALRLASNLATLVARNPVPEESRAKVAGLLREAFTAFGAAARPDIVFFKSLYRFVRDEGYPVKQQWVPTLPAADRTAVAALLNRPLAEQTAPVTEVARLRLRLENYLRGHTEVLLD